MTYDVFLVGNATMDLIFTGIPNLPVLGEDTFTKGFECVPGESFTNAVTMHRLGLKVAWAADFGNDLFSNLVLEEVRKEGLSEEFFVFHDHPIRRVSVALSFPEDRAFLTYYDQEPAISAAISALPSVKAKIIFIPGLIHNQLFRTAIPFIKLKKMRIFMDGNCQKEITLSKNGVIQALRSVDVFLPNAKEAMSLTGCSSLSDAALKLSEYCSLVVIKDGSRGSIAYDRQNLYSLRGIQAASIETTGAGDSFSSGFVKGMLSGYPLDLCLAWGNICGGLSTQGYGGTTEWVSESVVRDHLLKFYPNLL